MSRTGFPARLGAVVRIARRRGPQDVARRVVRLAQERLGAGDDDVMLRPADIVGSASVDLGHVPRPTGGPLTVGWVMVAPGAGSGGHTTVFRMIAALEAAGHRCVIHLYNVFDSDIATRRDVIRRGWPDVRAEVRDVADGVHGVDALVATSWQTAHVAARHARDVARTFYFVQDYEPYFYPHGSEAALAEDTYRFGFVGITAGRWLADVLAARHGMVCHPFDFGADSAVYTCEPDAERHGVVFYTKPGVPRRGYLLGIEAVRRFAAARPDVTVHLVGDPVPSPGFPAVVHGRVTPARLNEIYADCRVGLSLSFTNVSLLPWELLLAGVVPVVNDADHNRAVLTADGVRWAAPTVDALADALVGAYDGYDAATAHRLSRTVSGTSWDVAAGAVVDAIVDHTCRPA